MSKHVVITGTGRSGTSFIMELLTNLGLDTGFDVGNIKKHEYANAGMEIDLLQSICPPYVVKDPVFSDYVTTVIDRRDIQLDHVFVVLRDLEAAVESRVDVERRTNKSGYREGQVPGGFSMASNAVEQKEILLLRLFNLSLELARTDCRITFISYPLLVDRSDYLYDKLEPILEGVSAERFSATFNRLVDKSKVHKFSESDISPEFRRYSRESISKNDAHIRVVKTQIFYDFGSGYSEKESDRFTHTHDCPEICLDLRKKSGLKTVRFDPGDDPCIIELKSIFAVYEDGRKVELKSFIHNGYESGYWWFFTDTDPQIEISFGELNNFPDFLNINLEFIDIGRSVKEKAIPVIENYYKKMISEIERNHLNSRSEKAANCSITTKLKSWFLK